MRASATERIDLMYNDFVIVGPRADPAGIRGETKAVNALKKISEKGFSLCIQGRQVGQPMWPKWTYGPKAGVRPRGPWYTVYEKGSEGKRPPPFVTPTPRAPIRSSTGRRFFRYKRRSGLPSWWKRMKP